MKKLLVALMLFSVQVSGHQMLWRTSIVSIVPMVK